MALPPNILPPSLGDDVSSLVNRAKLQEMVPNSTVTFSDEDITTLMNQEFQATIVPLVQSVREEYMVVTRDYVLPPVTGTANVVNYLELPDEATGLALRDVYVTDNEGNFANIPRLAPEYVAGMSSAVWWGTTNPNATYQTGGFYVQGNRLILYPYTIANNRPIRLTYNQRPSMLTLTQNAAQILTITGNTITLGATVNSWTAGKYVDFIKNSLPHDFVTDIHATQSLYSSPVALRAVPIGAASGSTLTFEPGITDCLHVGDWITNYASAPFAMLIPLEATNCLVQATAIRLLEALGAEEKEMQIAQNKYDRMARDCLKLISPRVVGKTQKIAIPNKLSRSSNINNGTNW